MPDKIENFLNDLICLINKDLLDYLRLSPPPFFLNVKEL
ncbi:hypothetical protein K682_0903 [Campylobacter jejuni HB-CJGB-ZX]|nr:hypothetical protein K682_0903 [Campylobacter jejuni HB-CJGB-ZX]